MSVVLEAILRVRVACPFCDLCHGQALRWVIGSQPTALCWAQAVKGMHRRGKSDSALTRRVTSDDSTSLKRLHSQLCVPYDNGTGPVRPRTGLPATPFVARRSPLTRIGSVGVPARYVSGYLHPRREPEVGQEVAGESHAWIEFFDGAWTGWDPTNDIAVGDRHVIVARARDYSDVSPLQGVYSGPKSSVAAQVLVTRVA